MTISKGTQAEILAAIKQHGSVWVRGSARDTVRKMAKKGLVNFFPECVTDVNSSRSHEEFHVLLSGRGERK